MINLIVSGAQIRTVSRGGSYCGSGNVILDGSLSGATYKLYKDGIYVSGQDKTGTGSALSWSVTQSGTYTVQVAAGNGINAATMTGSTVTTINTLPSPTFSTAPVTSSFNTDVTYTTESGQNNYIWTFFENSSYFHTDINQIRFISEILIQFP